MLTKAMQCGPIAGMLIASMSWHSGTNFRLLLDLAVCLSAAIVVQRAVRAQEYCWATALAAIVLLLSPVVPALTPAGSLILFLLLVPLLPFVIGFVALVEAIMTFYPNLITVRFFEEPVADASDQL